MGGRGRSGCLSFLAAAALLLFAANGAVAATVVNGDFESGTLNGWHVHKAIEAGDWFAYRGTVPPIGSKRSNAHPLQAPPQGTYAAITDEANPDTLILYQDIALEGGRSHRLSLLAYYNSYEPIAVPTPDTLSVTEERLAGQRNQQFRIDVMKPSAPLESVDPADILRTLFETKPGAAQNMSPTRLTADLSQFAGQTVRLRIANAVHEEVFNAGVDAIAISSDVPGQSQSGGSKRGPSLFSFGKVKANRRNGSATLQVKVSGPGLLSAKNPPPSPHAARKGRTKKPRRLIKPVSVRVAAAKTVTLQLKPTRAALDVLRQKHRLRVKVAVTFMPTGDSPETAILPVVLRLNAGPSRRH
jgi:hypothetical protein